MTLLLLSAQAFACEASLNIKQLHQLSHDTIQLEKQISQELETKGFVLSHQSSSYRVKINLSKGRDFRSPNKFFAKSSLSLYEKSKLLNYTHGQGQIKETTSDAYTLNEFYIALKNTISHLPHCSSLPWFGALKCAIFYKVFRFSLHFSGNKILI